MNAMMQERHDEVAVVANETIEVSLGFMRTSIEDVKADVRGLQADNRSIRDKIDDTRTELAGRIEQVRTELDHKFDQLGVRLDNKIDTVRADQKTLQDALEKKIQGVDDKLGAKIDQLSSKLGETNVCVAKVATSQRTLFWLVGGTVSAAGLLEMVIRAGEKFHWF
jgi:chromosome segregation ATPase